MGFPGGAVVKNPSANAGDVRDAGSNSESGRFSGEGNPTHPSILAWETSWREESAYSSWGHKTVDSVLNLLFQGLTSF